MITDIPSGDDFRRAGLAFMNLAADQIFALYEDLEHENLEEEELLEYWRTAQQPLASALALVQQSVEFLMKGRIADHSVYLLLTGSPGDWPSKFRDRDIPFSEFRTIDAQDLPRVYDTVADLRLSESFRQRFNELRSRRNTIMHTVDNRLELTAKAILESILDTLDQLIGPHLWFQQRREYLKGTPVSALYSNDHVDIVLSSEAAILIGVLTPAQSSKYLAFNMKARRYMCPTCHAADEYDTQHPTTAQLRPNDPTSTTVHCVVCGESETVARVRCKNHTCLGNVIVQDSGWCLTCLHYQDDLE